MLKRLFNSKKGDAEQESDRIPKHIAMVMDGNGRWAKERGLPRTAGHQQGVKALKEVARACGDLGIKYLTVYAFSTENWHRPKKEVDFLMKLFSKVISDELQEVEDENVRIQVLGRKENLSATLLDEINKVEKRTKDNDGLVLNICFNYGGRAEIVDAAKKMLSQGLDPEELNEETFVNYLYTNNLPEIEVLVRTGYEKRLSNFLLYQAAYAELIFLDMYWPDFGKETLFEVVKEFQNRERRFGRV